MRTSKITGIIAIVLLVVGIYIGWNMVPPYFHNYQFQDDLDDIARRNSYLHRTDEEIKDLVIKQAGTMDIPLNEEQITITRTADGLGISVRYRIHVDMIIHPVD